MESQRSLFGPDKSDKEGAYSFDLETKKTFHEVGGSQNARDLGVSVAVLRNEETDEYSVYQEEDVNQLIDTLFSAEKVIGFNLLGFDYQVLAPYTPMDFSEVKTVDMMKDLEDALGKRMKLDDVADATLDASKSADGLQAVTWYKQGEIDKIIKYCKKDVEITSEVYRFGKDHGYVQIPAMDQVKDVQVDWKVREGNKV